jgi:hypothetical protein
MKEPAPYRFTVDYDQSIEGKLAVRETDRIGWATEIATDTRFFDPRRGRRLVTARLVRFDEPVHPHRIEAWCEENGKVLAQPKDLIDLRQAYPSPALDDEMPIVALGRLWVDPELHSIGGALHLYRDANGTGLHSTWLCPSATFGTNWRFLVLDREGASQ